ncbi:MAG TPA: single-stranded DNA-binding protein, partial [Ruminococcaceae bacterium]|nr:single-stranded DNA-binding protein [Oscillospiraceae bacterium]
PGGRPAQKPEPAQKPAPAADKNQPAPSYSNGENGDFEEIPSDDDLPF